MFVGDISVEKKHTTGSSVKKVEATVLINSFSSWKREKQNIISIDVMVFYIILSLAQVSCTIFHFLQAGNKDKEIIASGVVKKYQPVTIWCPASFLNTFKLDTRL